VINKFKIYKTKVENQLKN